MILRLARMDVCRLDKDTPMNSARPTFIEVMFLILVFSLGFMQPNLGLTGVNVQLTEPLFLIAVLVFAVAVFLKKITLRWDNSFFFFGAYLIALSLSAVFSASPRTSSVKLLGEFFLVGLAVMSVQIIRTKETLKRVILVWIAAGTIVSIIGTLTVLLFYIDRDSIWHTWFLHHYGSLPPGNYPRVQSTFVYPALLCSYLGVSLLLILAALKLKWLGEKISWTLILLHAITIMFTLTPGIGGVMFSLFAWTAVCFYIKGRSKVGYFMMAGGVLSAMSFFAVSALTLRHIPTSPYVFNLGGIRIDPTQRLLAWQGAFETFLAHPLFGKGLGLGVCKVLFTAPSGQQQTLTDAHNIWLSIAGQSGIFALIAFTALTAYLLYRIRQLLNESGLLHMHSETAILPAIFGLAILSSVLVQGLTGSFENARHLWILFGMAMSLKHLSIGQTENSSTTTPV